MLLLTMVFNDNVPVHASRRTCDNVWIFDYDDSQSSNLGMYTSMIVHHQMQSMHAYTFYEVEM